MALGNQPIWLATRTRQLALAFAANVTVGSFAALAPTTTPPSGGVINLRDNMGATYSYNELMFVGVGDVVLFAVSSVNGSNAAIVLTGCNIDWQGNAVTGCAAFNNRSGNTLTLINTNMTSAPNWSSSAPKSFFLTATTLGTASAVVIGSNCSGLDGYYTRTSVCTVTYQTPPQLQTGATSQISITSGPALGTGSGTAVALNQNSTDKWANFTATTGTGPSQTGGQVATLTYGINTGRGSLAPIVVSSAGPAYATVAGGTSVSVFLCNGTIAGSVTNDSAYILTASNTYTFAVLKNQD